VRGIQHRERTGDRINHHVARIGGRLDDVLLQPKRLLVRAWILSLIGSYHTSGIALD
jgi:hypothetical protein